MKAKYFLNKIFITPNRDQYSLIQIRKQGKTTIFVYEWTNCPDEYLKLFGNKIQSKSILGVYEVVQWINDLRIQYNTFKNELI